MKQEKKIISAALTMTAMAVLAMLAQPVAGKSAEVTHPELNEQEMLIACSECHRESTPDLENVITSYSIHYTKLYDVSGWNDQPPGYHSPAKAARSVRKQHFGISSR